MSFPTEPEHVARGVAIEGERVSLGQRRINLIWEVTQAGIALLVTATALLSSVGLTPIAGPALVGNAFFLVIGFYFGRTNHQRIGGVGPMEGR